MWLDSSWSKMKDFRVKRRVSIWFPGEFAFQKKQQHVFFALRARSLYGRGRYQAPALAVAWIAQVFLGLEHMHRRMDTLLRDLKPDNVVLSASGVAKLTDFGFGRFGVEASSGTWSFGVPAGSPGYVAPEVILQRNYDYSTLKKKATELDPLTWFLICGVLHGNFWEKNSFVCCVPKKEVMIAVISVAL